VAAVGATGRDIGRTERYRDAARNRRFAGYNGTERHLARIIHEQSVRLRFASRKSDEYARKVADSLHLRLQTLKIEFPLFINKTRLRE
jgi:hypothetical protein